MPRVLVDNVWVDGVMYAVGSTPEDPDVVCRMGDHCWRELGLSEPPALPAPTSPDPEQSFAVEEVGPSIFAKAEPTTEAEPTAGALPIPPKGGPGSGKSAWADYARSHNVSVEPGSSRDDIIDQLDDANVPTE